MDFLCVTNNNAFYEKYKEELPVEYLSGASIREIMVAVRDKLHQGYKLLTHPLSGSVKPNETPFKTIIIAPSAERENASVIMIENAIAACDKFPVRDVSRYEGYKSDFEAVDLSLAESALQSIL